MAKRRLESRAVGEYASQGITAFGGLAEAPQDRFALEVSDEHGRIEAVLGSARQAGLLADKTARISGRISPALLEQAKRRTGIMSDTDLLEFALANVAIEDGFAEAFRKVRGTVDPSIELGF